MDTQPHRAEALFAALLDSDPLVNEKEIACVTAVSMAMEVLLNHMNAARATRSRSMKSSTSCSTRFPLRFS